VGVADSHMLDRTVGRKEKKSLAMEKSSRSSESYLVLRVTRLRVLCAGSVLLD